MSKEITVQVDVNEGIDKVWKAFTVAEDIMKWNHASDDWHCPKAKNDLKVGGKFCYTMASKDGKESFDFSGVYTEIEPLKLIAYKMDDGRKAEVVFASVENETAVFETFELENINPEEMQRQGWQAILNNFKKHVESI
ncbi:MAG TPA: SRPBCC family protein [Candidatus Nanoarchaeia archaeon]|nr:SRPBCC family protein [Candidatus Nanoarchaeia archaeon]